MDIHRSRFVPYPASAISALAFSRSSNYGYSGIPPALKLAIGRSNGDIEIWNPQNGLWSQETVFPGDDRSIDGLAWTQDPDELGTDGKRFPGQQRLFSIASSPSVTEWDLATGTPKRESTGNFSEVWCFAAQPRARQKNGDEEVGTQEIVAGCGDGTMILLSTADDDLQFKRFLARAGGKRQRCMCVTYQTRDRIVAGYADGMIRIYDTRNGSLLRQMSLGASLPGMPKNAMVWQVKCLPDGDIVTGDSNGEVRFWDGKTYSLSQRVKGHDTDCLDLITSADGKTVFSGSIDGKLAIYRQSGEKGKRKSWARSSHRRVHSGEVKAMAAFDNKAMSVVVSGGGDAAPMVTPLREYGKENLRALSHLPQEPALVSALKPRLIVSWWAKTVCIWRLARQSAGEDTDSPTNPRRLVAKLTLDFKRSIRSVTISPDGRRLAASSSTETKLFQLRRRTGSDSLAVRKLSLPDDMAGGARILAFSPNGRWLAAVSANSEVHIGRQSPDETSNPEISTSRILSKIVELDRRRRRDLPPSTLKAYDRTITRLAWSSDSSVLVASDLSGFLDSWVLEGHEDSMAEPVDTSTHHSRNGSTASSSDSDSSSDDDDQTVIYYGQHWTDNHSGHLLPKLDSAPLILTFRPAGTQTIPTTNGNPGIHPTRHNPHAHSHELPSGQHRLFVITAKHQMYEFDVLAGKLSDWSRRNPTSALPEEFRQVRDRAVGAVWDCRGGQERVWLYCGSFLGMLDVGRDLVGGGQGGRKRRRKLGNGELDGEEAAEDVDEVVGKRRKLESGSGAGDRIEGAHAFPPAAVATVDNADDAARQDNARVSDEADGDDDEAEDDDVDLSLTRLRGTGEDERRADERAPGEVRWWHTFKYRPILGMVPISGDSEDGPLEVALVERPVWDALNEGKKREEKGA